MDKINYESMRSRIEFLFRLIGKQYSRTDSFPPDAVKRLVSMITTDGINLIFLHRYDDKISFEASERKTQVEFAEIVIRYMNSIRKAMQTLPPAPTEITIGNIEILIRDGINDMLNELKAFFERMEKAEEKKEEPAGKIKSFPEFPAEVPNAIQKEVNHG
jgi:hypothetical protein